MNFYNFILVGASALAGAINSVAGGGTLLTFPALLAAGLTSVVANATNTVALWPGQLSSLWGYRDSLQQGWRTLLPLFVLGLLGGLFGAWLLTVTPVSLFDRLVPFLVLAATLIFAAQGSLSRWTQKKSTAIATDTTADEVVTGADAPLSKGGRKPLHTLFVILFLLAISVYGGYFGAGIGILTLAAFGFLGMKDIHQMNGIKAFFTLGINGIAAILFMVHGLVEWRVAAIMAVGSIFGGWAGADIARRIGQKNVRRTVIAIGFILTISLLLKH